MTDNGDVFGYPDSQMSKGAQGTGCHDIIETYEAIEMGLRRRVASKLAAAVGSQASTRLGSNRSASKRKRLKASSRIRPLA